MNEAGFRHPLSRRLLKSYKEYQIFSERELCPGGIILVGCALMDDSTQDRNNRFANQAISAVRASAKGLQT